MISFVKKNQNIENYFISKELIPFETDKESFINLPNHNRNIWKYLTGTELINLYNQYKQNYFTRMHKALFKNEPKKVKTNNNNNLINWNHQKVEQLIRDLEEL